MSFCLNCGNHKTCQCAGPPPEVSFGPTVESLEAREHLPKHPATKWFDQQVEEVLIPDGHIDPSGYPIGIDGEFFKHLMTKAFNAGACHACQEISDVIPRGPLNDCCKDELQFAIEDIDAICAEWLG